MFYIWSRFRYPDGWGQWNKTNRQFATEAEAASTKALLERAGYQVKVLPEGHNP